MLLEDRKGLRSLGSGSGSGIVTVKAYSEGGWERGKERERERKRERKHSLHIQYLHVTAPVTIFYYISHIQTHLHEANKDTK